MAFLKAWLESGEGKTTIVSKHLVKQVKYEMKMAVDKLEEKA